MVLTPQLLQAIKLLQMPNFELTQFIENELASNPLLDRAEEREEPSFERPSRRRWLRRSAGRAWRLGARGAETDAGRLAANLGTEIDNAFDADRTAPAVQSAPAEQPERALPGRASAPATTPARPPISKLMSRRPCRFATISSVRPRSCLPTRPIA